MTHVTVVDYGVGNLLGIRRAFEHCGATVSMSADPDTVAAADRLLLPGVGAFGQAVKQLRERQLFDAVVAWAGRGRPLLGICLGMQLLCSSSDEFGHHQGLDLIRGTVIPVPPTGSDGAPHKIPFIGWSELIPAGGRVSFDGTILEGVGATDSVYFVHSFMAVTDNLSDTLAVTDYDGISVPAVIARDNIFGCQFHPEKSGEVGLSIIRRFLRA